MTTLGSAGGYNLKALGLVVYEMSSRCTPFPLLPYCMGWRNIWRDIGWRDIDQRERAGGLGPGCR